MRCKALSLQESIKWLERERSFRPTQPVLGRSAVSPPDSPDQAIDYIPTKDTPTNTPPTPLGHHRSQFRQRSFTPGAGEIKFTNKTPPTASVTLSVPVIESKRELEESIKKINFPRDVNKVENMSSSQSAFTGPKPIHVRLGSTPPSGRMTKSLTALPGYWNFTSWN